jgi:hypothetical protein
MTYHQLRLQAFILTIFGILDTRYKLVAVDQISLRKSLTYLLSLSPVKGTKKKNMSSSFSCPFPSLFGIGAASSLLFILLCHSLFHHSQQSLSYPASHSQSIFFRSTSSSPSFHIYVHHSSSHMIFLSPHHMSMPAHIIFVNPFLPHSLRKSLTDYLPLPYIINFVNTSLPSTVAL